MDVVTYALLKNKIGDLDSLDTTEKENLVAAINEIVQGGGSVHGIPTGGTTGQALKKASDTDYDVEWGAGGGGVSDVQVNGTSIVSDGVANVPLANSNTPGVVGIADAFGIGFYSGTNLLVIKRAQSDEVKAGINAVRPIVPFTQHESSFYGLAKASGDSTQSASANAVGTYTETAKSKISDMLNAPETVSGSTPSITAKSGVRYICGECSTLSITAPESGCIDVVFESGSTPTVLTVTSAKTGVTAIKWANGFDPTSLEANTTYEINILDGEYGVSGSWT